MTMQLTNEEEKELQQSETPKKIIKKAKYGMKDQQICEQGHPLNYVYWRSHTEKHMGKIIGLFFCPKCEKLYQIVRKEFSLK